MSECSERIYHAIQSVDDGELRSYVSRVAHAARRNHGTLECVIIDLKRAVNSLPASSFRVHVRRELCDSVVRIAIRAYYDGTEALPAGRRWH